MRNGELLLESQKKDRSLPSKMEYPFQLLVDQAFRWTDCYLLGAIASLRNTTDRVVRYTIGQILLAFAEGKTISSDCKFPLHTV